MKYANTKLEAFVNRHGVMVALLLLLGIIIEVIAIILWVPK